MVEWITLQQTADKIGVRKGTLAMWRSRNRFPFKTKGNARKLVVNADSVDTWLAERKNKPVKKKKKVRKARTGMRKVAKRGRPKGRPAKKTGAAAGRPGKKGCEIVVQGGLDLETIQNFVTQLKGGADLQISPAKDGYILKTV